MRLKLFQKHKAEDEYVYVDRDLEAEDIASEGDLSETSGKDKEAEGEGEEGPLEDGESSKAEMPFEPSGEAEGPLTDEIDEGLEGYDEAEEDPLKSPESSQHDEAGADEGPASEDDDEYPDDTVEDSDEEDEDEEEEDLDDDDDYDDEDEDDNDDGIAQGEPLIELRDIYKIYTIGGEEVHANDGITLTINKGEFVAIIGKSGSGKSTLMNIIGALDVPTSGEYILAGEDTSEMTDDELSDIRNHRIGFIFQQYNLLMKLDLLENVELPLIYQGYDKKTRHEKAMEALARVGLDKKWRNTPLQLSGGQQQRVSIARALCARPSIILADEPTGALDSRTSKEVLGLIDELNKEGNTIVMITHDSSIALWSKRVVEIVDGKIIFDGDVDSYARKLQNGN